MAVSVVLTLVAISLLVNARAHLRILVEYLITRTKLQIQLCADKQSILENGRQCGDVTATRPGQHTTSCRSAVRIVGAYSVFEPDTAKPGEDSRASR